MSLGSFLGNLFGGSQGQAGQQNANASTAAADAQKVFGEQQGFEGMLMSLLENPSSVTKLPGYQFLQQQGTQNTERAMAATGFGGSGNEAGALSQYNQGLASSFYGQQASLLASLSGMAPSSTQGLLGVSTASANAATEQSNNILGGFGNVLGGLFNSVGGWSGIGNGLSGIGSWFSGIGGAAAGTAGAGSGAMAGLDAATFLG